MVKQIHQNVLIISSENDINRIVLEVLTSLGIRGMVVKDLSAASKKLSNRQWDLVLADLELTNGQGSQILQQAKKDYPETPVIFLVNNESLDKDPQIRDSADDLLAKPISTETVRSAIESLLPSYKVPLAAACDENPQGTYQIVGQSKPLLEIIEMAQRIAPTSAPVLLAGESGTGKELISSLIHQSSKRAKGPFIKVNCAALSESLLESELFGHERGAFTGAYTQRKGRFERAHGGTLLLDEISETPKKLQAELLRVLEQQDFERLGGSKLISVNVRVISTSNRDLIKMIESGKFRQDLYYRLCGIKLTVPSLRQRTEDIPLLVWHFINLYAREVRRKITDLDPKMMDLFSSYHWPGNIRQLRNVVRTAIILGSGPVLSLDEASGLIDDLSQKDTSQEQVLSLRELERQAIYEALRQTKSHQAKAASLLGITDRTLRDKLRKYQQNAELQTTRGARWLSRQE